MRNIVLIVVDTLRADHLGCYGYKRPTSPFLDELAAKSL
ncbi:MAG: sulfatase-like hydrolase/transferase, partial [Candidatus Krumholzibacteria bacterium]|nr:sulfatase-like hydrolase/transferase [Candidatus Krumholzibacteria bacterium]